MTKLSYLKERPTRLKNKSPLIKQAILLSTIAVVSLGLAQGGQANANSYQAQIDSLRHANSESLANQRTLQAQEQNISTVIANLQASIAGLEKQIQDNNTRHNELTAKIAEAETEIQEQRKLLGVNLKQLYLDDQMSNLEKLASSKTIGDYVDKEQYRIAVQNKIKTAMDRIAELKKQQEEQRTTIEKILNDQKGMQAELAAQKAENERLLSMNQQQQAAYSSQVSSNNSRIAELQRQQAAANASSRVGSASIGGSGGYPWANHPFPNTIVDPWGMYTRQCVSYTAWRVANSGRYMPYWGGRGNANQWDDNARAAGIPVDYNPRVGDIAVSNSGYYGHVMYVEGINGDGTITVSDYNSNWDGRYAYYRRYTAGLVFIHF